MKFSTADKALKRWAGLLVGLLLTLPLVVVSGSELPEGVKAGPVLLLALLTLAAVFLRTSGSSAFEPTEAARTALRISERLRLSRESELVIVRLPDGRSALFSSGPSGLRLETSWQNEQREAVFHG